MTRESRLLTSLRTDRGARFAVPDAVCLLLITKSKRHVFSGPIRTR